MSFEELSKPRNFSSGWLLDDFDADFRAEFFSLSISSSLSSRALLRTDPQDEPPKPTRIVEGVAVGVWESGGRRVRVLLKIGFLKNR